MVGFLPAGTGARAARADEQCRSFDWEPDAESGARGSSSCAHSAGNTDALSTGKVDLKYGDSVASGTTGSEGRRSRNDFESADA